MTVIEIDGLTKQYGNTTAVNGVSLSVEDGQLYAFIGPNGAGKTTMIEMLTGQISPSSGSATVLGRDPQQEPKAVRASIGILPEREDPPSFLTPREYARFVGETRGIEDCVDERLAVWAERLRFEDQLDTICKDLSKGEKQKVMITQAFLHEPELVFIDEPLINLDPIIQAAVSDFIEDYRDDGNTVFLSTHVLALAEELCTHVGIIDRGELIADDSKEALLDEGETLTDAFMRLVDR